MDQTLFFTLNNLAGRWPWLDALGVFCAVYLLWIMLAGLIVLWFVKPRAPHRLAVFVALISAVVARFGVGTILKLLFARPRPYEFLPVRQLILESGWSFPSGHATFAFGLATGVYLYNRKFGYLAYTGAILVSISRVFVGVHWPSDIIAGAAIGIITAYIINRGVHALVKSF